MNARRTVVRLIFDGVDISADINRYLQSLTYTDNEQDKTDDISLSIDDREGVWLGSWLNTPGAAKGAELSAVIIEKTGFLIAAHSRSTPFPGVDRRQKLPSRAVQSQQRQQRGRRKKQRRGKKSNFRA